ncbi:hypothetical protein SAMN04515618_11546 [Collimonas sp. OK307]|uniref:hypothetical protein n=1 Tax=Collimonas sp. OK307 TaxID=1801620 RepID=UPI0008F0060B|nr:hypothetical protein [Collimonas sp. OK307]SFI25965.1 hypothetical protein SAMN04515618_11546 [Collimonas sp. OK307]
MHTKQLLSALKLGSLAALFSVGLASSALAAPVMDFHVEDVLSVAGGVKDELHLNANQQTLWRQLETRTHTILSDREKRQHDLQANMSNGLKDPAIDLRQLSAAIDTESGLAAQEGRQLRELWLTMNDALDDQQRQAVRLFLADRLVRVDKVSCEPGSTAGKDKPSGKGHGKGMGGMGGMGGTNGGGM